MPTTNAAKSCPILRAQPPTATMAMVPPKTETPSPRCLRGAPSVNTGLAGFASWERSADEAHPHTPQASHSRSPPPWLAKFAGRCRVTALRGVADDSGGASTEMRAASGGLRTFHRSCARAAQEDSEFPTEITHDGSLVRIRFGEEITHLGLVRHSLVARIHRATGGAIKIQKSAWKPAHQRRERNDPLGAWCCRLSSFQTLQASHVNLNTNDDVYLRHDALDGRHLENLSARLQGADKITFSNDQSSTHIAMSAHRRASGQTASVARMTLSLSE